MFSRFFIYRPIFASVIAIVIVLVGFLSIPLLPIESMPVITPPSVQVTTARLDTDEHIYSVRVELVQWVASLDEPLVVRPTSDSTAARAAAASAAAPVHATVRSSSARAIPTCSASRPTTLTSS